MNGLVYQPFRDQKSFNDKNLPCFTYLLHSIQLLAFLHVSLDSFHLLLRDKVAVHLLQVAQEVRVRHHSLCPFPAYVANASDYYNAFAYHLG